MRMTKDELAALAALAQGLTARRVFGVTLLTGNAHGDELAELLDRIIADAVTDAPGPMTRRALDDIVAKIECPTVEIETRSLDEGGHLVRVTAWREDIDDGVERKLGGRWFYVSSHATETEVVNTVWLAWQVFEHHELREAFTFDGVAIFHPHQRVGPLAEHVANTMPDSRTTGPRDEAAEVMRAF